MTNTKLNVYWNYRLTHIYAGMHYCTVYGFPLITPMFHACANFNSVLCYLLYHAVSYSCTSSRMYVLKSILVCFF